MVCNTSSSIAVCVINKKLVLLQVLKDLLLFIQLDKSLEINHRNHTEISTQNIDG